MSAMFDDWAYSSVYEPPSPPRAPKPEGKRPRAVSIVRTLAQAPSVPDPEVRPRASTVAGPETTAETASDACSSSDLAAFLSELRVSKALNGGRSSHVDVPLTKRELAANWDLDAWLGHHSPSMFEFSEDVWAHNLVPYHEALQEAELGALLAGDAGRSAENMVSEVDWLLHELRDTREHDLEPMRAAVQRVQGLKEQQSTLASVNEALETAWNAQERIMRMLHGPAPRAVPKLGEIMAQVDKGLQFCDKHADFLGIGVTKLAWRSCANRALAIAAAYCTHELRKVVQRIKTRVSETSSDGARHALIYTKFASDSERLQPVLALLRDHSHGSVSLRPETGTAATSQGTAEAPRGEGRDPDLDEHWAYFQSIYFGLRADLIGDQADKFSEPLAPFAQLGDEFMEAARSTLVQFRQLYAAEQRLYEKLLGPATADFWNWMADVSDPLYAVVRRLIVRETDLGKLGQLILLVHGESPAAAQDRDSRGSEDEDVLSSKRTGFTGDTHLRGSVSLASDERTTLGNGESRTAESPFDVIYKDAQNRLVFRANLIVDGLARYEPTTKDLLRARYPTVEQALNLLGQVYELLNTRVFNDLAHRCVRECLVSLDTAVANRVVASSGTDVVRLHLFHIKQLLTLQSQIVDFDLQRTVVHEVDFSGIQRLMLRDTGRATSASSFRDLLALAWDSVPQVVEIMFDAMEELYGSLRMAVDRMCGAFVDVVAGPLASKSEPAAEFRAGLVSALHELTAAVSEYISNSEVANFLLDSVQDAVMDRYAAYYRSLPPSDLGDESLMDIDTMASWLSSTIVDTRK